MIEEPSIFSLNIFNVIYNKESKSINPKNEFNLFLEKLCEEFKIDINDKYFLKIYYKNKLIENDSDYKDLKTKGSLIDLKLINENETINENKKNDDKLDDIIEESNINDKSNISNINQEEFLNKFNKIIDEKISNLEKNIEEKIDSKINEINNIYLNIINKINNDNKFIISEINFIYNI